MSTLIAAGCSVTHGADTFNSFMHPENVKYSYPNLVAEDLGIELLSVALSGASNDYIFHSTIEAINSTDDIHSVIVAWTSITRLHWINEGRHWFFNPGWACSVVDPVNFEPSGRKLGPVWLCGDNDQVLDDLGLQHKFLINNYLRNFKWLFQKLKNYSQTINALCDQKGIKLVELSAFGTFNTKHNNVDYIGHPIDINGVWRTRGNAHPSIEEHKVIAQQILEKFYGR
jgi:hypothetical protein